eukprot:scaffold52325_cov264-Isochrysis_galbana.AAC.1
MLAIIARQVTCIRANSFSPTRPVNRAWFSPSSMRCLRPCTPPVRLFSVYSLHVQPSIRQTPTWGRRPPGEGRVPIREKREDKRHLGATELL